MKNDDALKEMAVGFVSSRVKFLWSDPRWLVVVEPGDDGETVLLAGSNLHEWHDVLGELIAEFVRKRLDKPQGADLSHLPENR